MAIPEDRTRSWKAAYRLGFCGQQQVVVMGVRRDVRAAESEALGALQLEKLTAVEELEEIQLSTVGWGYLV